MTEKQAQLQQQSESYRGMIWRRFKRNKLAVVCLVLVALLGLTALAAPMLANDKPIVLQWNDRLYFPIFKRYPELSFIEDYSEFEKTLAGWKGREWMLMPPVRRHPNANNLDAILKKPSREHPMGTDDSGRDVLSRMIYGTRISMTVGFVSVFIYVFIAVVLGSLAGYFGGRIDNIISRLIEIVICFPRLFLIIAVVSIISPSILVIVAALALFGWPGLARLVRGEYLRLKSIDFVTAARAAGATDLRIIFMHILPNAMTPVLVSATFGIAGAILTESALSFLGFGVPPPTPSWGEMLAQSQAYIGVGLGWWLVLFPGLAIFITVLALNLVGEGLRDAADPWLSK